jgi:hypothetical protein
MDLKNKSAAVGTPIQQWACNGGKNQEWIFVSVGGGAYNIESELTGKCVGIQGGKATSHAQLEEEDCDGGENQKFTLQAIAPGSDVFYIHAVLDDTMCFDIEAFSTAEGTTVQLFTCQGQTNQQWIIADHP